MTLQDLPVGEKIALEIVWGGGSCLVHTQVMGKSDEGTLLAPFEYSGTQLEIHSSRYRDMTFHLYGIDDKTGKRMVWKNVSLDTVKLPDKVFYLVKVSGFRKLAVDSERRLKRRIPLNCQASVYPRGGYARVVVKMNDISDGGLSFIAPKSAGAILEGKLTVMFDDNIRGHRFSISADCNYVHKKAKENEYIYGCSFVRVDKELLAYICLKRMEYEVHATE